MIQSQPQGPRLFSKLYRYHRQRFVRVTCIVWERDAAYTVGFMLVPHTGNEWVLTRRLCGVKDFDRTRTGNNDLAIGKTNPLIRIFRKKPVALNPIFGFVFLPVRVNPAGYFGGQPLNQAFHKRILRRVSNPRKNAQVWRR